MRLVLRHTFPLGRFHATPWRINPFDDPFGEWPPSPWRLTRAVVARWYQWRRETGETWPDEEVDQLVRALGTSDYSFYLPARARQSIILRQYQPVEFGWNPKSDKVGGVKSYSTSLVQDNAWCVPPDEDVFWFIDGDAWTLDLVEILDQCLERIVYFGRAESHSRIYRVTGMLIAANVTLSEHVSSGNAVPVLADPEAGRADIERVTQDPKAARNIPQGARMLYVHRPTRPSARDIPRRMRPRPATNLIQFALGWAVAPEPRATVRVTAQFRSAVLRHLFRIKTGGSACRWSDVPPDIRDEIAAMTGKNSQGEPLQGPRQHAEFLLWWDGGLPTRLLVWRNGRSFDEAEQESILYAAADEKLSWAAIGSKGNEWKIKLVPLDTAVPRPPGFDGKSALVWQSITPYVPTRHHLRGGRIRDSETIENQVRRELCARGYAPNTKLLSVEEIPPPRWVAVHVPRRDSSGRPFIGDRRGYMLRLAFDASINGPLRLGHSSSFGLGLFAPHAG